MKVVLKALPDWMLRREKRRSVAYGVCNVASVPPCTLASEDAHGHEYGSVPRSVAPMHLRTLAFDPLLTTRKSIQEVHPIRQGEPHLGVARRIR